jgi:hypothetical protein
MRKIGQRRHSGFSDVLPSLPCGHVTGRGSVGGDLAELHLLGYRDATCLLVDFSFLRFGFLSRAVPLHRATLQPKR